MKTKRGFALLSPEKMKSIARSGGLAQGKDTNPSNFANNRDRAILAGRKGGLMNKIKK